VGPASRSHYARPQRLVLAPGPRAKSRERRTVWIWRKRPSLIAKVLRYADGYPVASASRAYFRLCRRNVPRSAVPDHGRSRNWASVMQTGETICYRPCAFRGPSYAAMPSAAARGMEFFRRSRTVESWADTILLFYPKLRSARRGNLALTQR